MAYIKHKFIEPEKVIPAQEVEKITAAECDLCGDQVTYDIDHRTGGHGGVNWAESSYDFEVVTVSISEGCHYPEGGSKALTSYHVCPPCFHKNIVPLFGKKKPTYESTTL